MCITTADAHKVLCLFYDKLLELIASNQYGIECDNKELLTDLKALLAHYELGCLYNDYIRNLVIEEGDTVEDCLRASFEVGLQG